MCMQQLYVCADCIYLACMMKMAAYKCGLVLFMINLCWSSELYPASENTDDVQ